MLKKCRKLTAFLMAICLVLSMAPGALAAEAVGKLKVTLDNYSGDLRLVGSRETNSGDFAADAVYQYYNLSMGVTAAVVDAGSIQNGTITGDVTDETCKQIQPDGDASCVIRVTGQVLLDALEWGARNVGKSDSDAFLQVSGINYTVDASVPSTVQQKNGVWTGSPTGDYRVQDVTIWNRDRGRYLALDLSKTYRLAGYSDLLLDCEQGFAMFQGVEALVKDGAPDYEILAEFFQSFANNTVTTGAVGPRKASYEYVYGEGRITILGVFGDVNDHWSEAWVYAMYNAGMVQGVSASSFEPERKMTRAEFGTMLYRICGLSNDGYDNPFDDVEESDWYYDEVVALAENGIINGYGDGTFAPDKEISRQEMVQLVYNVSKMFELGSMEAEEGVYERFDDAGLVEDWARVAMNWAVSKGVINGYDNKLTPLNYTTRAEATTMLCNWLVEVGNRPA